LKNTPVLTKNHETIKKTTIFNIEFTQQNTMGIELKKNKVEINKNSK